MMTCDFAKEVEAELGKDASCWPNQMELECDYTGDPEYKCSWGSACPECGKRRVNAYDLCFGWHELCMNQECGMDK